MEEKRDPSRGLPVDSVRKHVRMLCRKRAGEQSTMHGDRCCEEFLAVFRFC